jgi:lycopene beta-cyclase
MTIGTAGGRVKASSGYAFTRIQQDSAAIVQSLIDTRQPFNVPADSSFYRRCDALLLRIMHRRGDTIKSIFAVMFKRNPVTCVLRFLDETSSVADTALLIANMPPRPFLQALYERSVPAMRALQAEAAPTPPIPAPLLPPFGCSSERGEVGRGAIFRLDAMNCVHHEA